LAMPDIRGEEHIVDHNISTFTEIRGWEFLFRENRSGQARRFHFGVRRGLNEHDGFGAGRFCEWTPSRETCFPVASLSVPCRICYALSLTYGTIFLDCVWMTWVLSAVMQESPVPVSSSAKLDEPHIHPRTNTRLQQKALFWNSARETPRSLLKGPGLQTAITALSMKFRKKRAYLCLAIGCDTQMRANGQEGSQEHNRKRQEIARARAASWGD
jgi:hypothetical protein